jgi:hypothetical protein
MHKVTDENGKPWTILDDPADLDVPEIAEVVEDAVGWFLDERSVNRDDYADRFEGTHLADGSRLELPSGRDAWEHPLMRALLREARKIHRESRA